MVCGLGRHQWPARRTTTRDSLDSGHGGREGAARERSRWRHPTLDGQRCDLATDDRCRHRRPRGLRAPDRSGSCHRGGRRWGLYQSRRRSDLECRARRPPCVALLRRGVRGRRRTRSGIDGPLRAAGRRLSTTNGRAATVHAHRRRATKMDRRQGRYALYRSSRFSGRGRGSRRQSLRLDGRGKHVVTSRRRASTAEQCRHCLSARRKRCPVVWANEFAQAVFHGYLHRLRPLPIVARESHLP